MGQQRLGRTDHQRHDPQHRFAAVHQRPEFLCGGIDLRAEPLGGPSWRLLVIDHWNINWGDGQTQTIPGNPSSVPHSYAAFGQYQITAVAVDTRGGSHAATPGPGDWTNGGRGRPDHGGLGPTPPTSPFRPSIPAAGFWLGVLSRMGAINFPDTLTTVRSIPALEMAADASRCRRRARIFLLRRDRHWGTR